MSSSNRFTALDEVRGFTIASMVLVNTPGSWTYMWSFLGHAEWHGLQFADLVFPFFLFISGFSMAYALHRRSEEIDISRSLAFKLFKRVALLFLIGLTLNWMPFQKSWEEVRIMGILQRIAMAYGIAAFLILVLKGKAKALLITAVGLLTLHQMGLVLGVSDSAHIFSLQDSFARKVDITVLGASHLYKGEGIAFDPEGLWGSLSAAVQVILGYVIGNHFRRNKDPQRDLVVPAIFLLGITLLLIYFIPINKKLWTATFVFSTSGLAIALLFLVMKMHQSDLLKKLSYPFRIIGMNPLFCFVLSVLIVKFYFLFDLPLADSDKMVNMYTWIYQSAYAPAFGKYLGSFLFAVSHVVLVWLAAYPLFKKRILIKL
jgi:predicted acyltransferase